MSVKLLVSQKALDKSSAVVAPSVYLIFGKTLAFIALELLL